MWVSAREFNENSGFSNVNISHTPSLASSIRVLNKSVAFQNVARTANSILLLFCWNDNIACMYSHNLLNLWNPWSYVWYAYDWQQAFELALRTATSRTMPMAEWNVGKVYWNVATMFLFRVCHSPNAIRSPCYWTNKSKANRWFSKLNAFGETSFWI